MTILSGRIPFEAGGPFPETIEKIKHRLNDRQIGAACRFVADLHSSNGRSGGLISSYAERVQTSLSPNKRMPGWNDAADRLSAMVAALGSDDRAILDWLTRPVDGNRTMTGYGARRSGYKNGQCAGAFLVGQIASLLSRMADVYEKRQSAPPPPKHARTPMPAAVEKARAAFSAELSA